MAQKKSEMVINSRLIRLANKTIAIRNLTEISIWRDEKNLPAARRRALAGVSVTVLSAYLFTRPDLLGDSLQWWVGFGVPIGVTLILSWYWTKAPYELQLQTSAGKVTALRSSDRSFIRAVMDKLNYAMSHEGTGNFEYHVNVDNKKISVENSPGVNIVGGNAHQVAQEARVS